MTRLSFVLLALTAIVLTMYAGREHTLPSYASTTVEALDFQRYPLASYYKLGNRVEHSTPNFINMFRCRIVDVQKNADLEHSLADSLIVGHHEQLLTTMRTGYRFHRDSSYANRVRRMIAEF